MLIRNYLPQDSQALVHIFKNAILAIDDSIYSPIQKQAWLGNRSDEFWQSRFDKSLPLVVQIDAKVVGFIEFTFDKQVGEIDCFYVEPTYQNLGVGKALLAKILSLAKDNHVSQIKVSASHIAKPFFEKQGFQTVEKNGVIREGIALENWLMESSVKFNQNEVGDIT